MNFSAACLAADAPAANRSESSTQSHPSLSPRTSVHSVFSSGTEPPVAALSSPFPDCANPLTASPLASKQNIHPATNRRIRVLLSNPPQLYSSTSNLEKSAKLSCQAPKSRKPRP